MSSNLQVSIIQAPGNPAKARLLRQLEELLNERNIDEDVVPTAHAFSTTWNLIDGGYPGMNVKLPPAVVSSDGDGGIRIGWAAPTRRVHLAIPGATARRRYVYYREKDRHGHEDDPTVQTLAKWLNWLGEDAQ